MKKLLILGIMLTALSGCGMDVKEIKKIPLMPTLSQKEIVEYYKESLKYNTIYTRNEIEYQIKYETTPVEESVSNKLDEARKIIETELSKIYYEDNMRISNTQFNYVKSIIDDRELDSGDVIGTQKYIEYYCIDVKYKARPSTSGKFLAPVSYLGIHGAFNKDENGKDSINTDLLQAYDILSQNNATLQKENTEGQIKDEQAPAINDGITHSLTMFVGRQANSRIKEYNEKSGGALTETAYMPKLELVFKPETPTLRLSGYGIYPQGIRGLAQFGYDRLNSTMEITLRYVFKYSILTGSKMEFVTVYPLNVVSEFNRQDTTSIVSEFVEEEIRKIIERSDRAINNNDITALAYGKIYNDIGIAVLNGFYQNNTYLSRYITELKNIVERRNNVYLIETESLIQEGPKDSNAYGIYKETKLMVIKQEGVDFVIDDYLITKREIVEEPEWELDKTIIKKLASLGLSGEISEETKEMVRGLLAELYLQSTNRSLNGMYACFNTDTTILSENRREYLNAQLREWLVKYGANNKSIYKGRVIEWIGGTTNQVELITEELIEYDNANAGQYMRIYYLVSNWGNNWVIDELKVLEIKEVESAEMQEISNRIK